MSRSLSPVYNQRSGRSSTHTGAVGRTVRAEELRPGPIEHIDRDYDQGCSPQMVMKTQITANPIGQTMLL